MKIKEIIKQPMLHFFVLGCLIFVANDFINKNEVFEEEKDNQILIDEDSLNRLVSSFKAQRGREPDKEELKNLFYKYLKQEIFYKEALKLNLEDNDEIIRRRLAQKIQFLAKDMVNINIEEKDVLDFYNKNIERYSSPKKYVFKQIYINPDNHKNATSYIESLREKIINNTKELPIDNVLNNYKNINPEWLNLTYNGISEEEIVKRFGHGFYEQMKDIKENEISPVISSGIGLHLVLLEDIIESKKIPFDKIESIVKNDYLYEAQLKASDDLFLSFFNNYSLVNTSGNKNIDKWVSSILKETSITNN